MQRNLTMIFVASLSLLQALFGPTTPSMAHDGPHGSDAAKRASSAAVAFLDGLDPEQRKQALFDFASAKKPNWSNLPTSFVPRNGVKLGDLTKDQRAKAMAVLAAVLSKEGFQKVVDIMDGDQQLVSGKSGAKGERGGKGPGTPGKGGKGP